MTKQLDRSRPFGTVFPPLGAVHFEQDGHQFDHEGNHLAEVPADPPTPSTTKQATPKGRQKKDKAATQPAAPTAKTKTKGKTKTEKTPAKPDPAPQTAAKGDDTGINLESWLKGKEQYPEFKIKQVVRARFNRVVNNMPDTVYFLVADPKGPKVVPVAAVCERLAKMIAKD